MRKTSDSLRKHPELEGATKRCQQNPNDRLSFPKEQAAAVTPKMTFAMLRTVPPAGRFLYGDIALLSEDEDENGSEGSGSEERSTNSASYRLSSSSQSAFHIKVNRKRKMCGSGGVDIASMGARLGLPGSPPPGEGRQRTAANARERDRTNSVNTAFTALRTLIPTEPADRYTCPSV